MKKLLLLFALFTSLFAQILDKGYVERLQSYLLQSSDLILNGKFYYYQKRWVLEALDAHGETGSFYLLLGNTPSKTNPFGWRKIDPNIDYIKSLSPKGYFIHIRFDHDPSAISWLYIDIASKKVYKLIDAKDGKFQYIPLDIKYALLKNRVFFFQKSDKLTYNTGVHIELERLSKDGGSLRINPTYLGGKPFMSLAKEINLSSLTIIQKAYGMAGNQTVEGTIVKYPLLGRVDIETKVGNYHAKCHEYYIPLEIDKLNRNDLEQALQKWGEGGPCSEEFVQSSCPTDYYQRLVKCGAKFDLSELSKQVDVSILTIYSINDKNESVVYERTFIVPEKR